MIRASVVFMVIGLLASGLLYDRVSDPAVEAPVAAESLIVTPSVTDPARLDGAWYCPVGSSIPLAALDTGDDSAVGEEAAPEDPAADEIDLGDEAATEEVDAGDEAAADETAPDDAATEDDAAVDEADADTETEADTEDTTVEDGQATEEGEEAEDEGPTLYADHVVVVSNLSDEAAVVNVTIVTDEGRGPTIRRDLAPASSDEIVLSETAQARLAGAVVEIVGGTGVVGHRVTTEFGTASGPCATHVSDSWYFAAGRTQRDSSNLLVLMNPFPEAVRYNVELYRSVGRPRLPGDLQGDSIPANSVKLIDIGEYVFREDVVAASITTVRGRIVAERLQLTDGSLGPEGAALQLGVPTPALSWMLPAGRIHETGDDQVIVFNPSADETATVEIELWPLNPTDRSLYGLGPIPRELLPGRFEVIDLGIEAARFRFRLPFEVGVSVRSTNNVPIVAERWHFAEAVDRNLIGAGGTELAPAEDDPIDPDDPAAEDGAVDPDDPAAEDGAVDPDDPAAEDGAVDPDDPAAEDGAVDPDDPAAEDGTEQPGIVDSEEPGELDVPGIFGSEQVPLSQPTATTGIASSRGTEVLSDRWLIPWVPTPTAESSVVIVTALEEATVEVFALVNGELQGPERGTVAPTGRTIIAVPPDGAGGPVVVLSSAPVSVEAQVVQPDGSLEILAGVPTIELEG